MKTDIDRWNEKYARHSSTGDIEPDPTLAAHRPILSGNGTALDLATGVGNNALYLAELGYETFAIDGSVTAVTLGKQKQVVNHLTINWLVADLDRFMPPKNFFDVVIVIKYLNRDLTESIKDSVRIGGFLLFKTFNTHFLAQKPSFPNQYVLNTGELSDWFNTWDCIETNDVPSNSEALSYWSGTKPSG